MSTTVTVLSNDAFINTFFPVGGMMLFLDFDKRNAYYDYLTNDTSGVFSGYTFEKGTITYRIKTFFYVKRTK